MFKNYLKIAMRNLLRRKAFSVINIAGLAIGIACCLFILLYVQDELSYERFHKNAKRIYRLVDDQSFAGQFVTSAALPPAWASLLMDQLPEVENAVRIRSLDLASPLIVYGEKRFYENAVWWIDSTFFQVFNFEFLEGRAEQALSAPDAVVITEKVAKKYFGDETALGKALVYNDEKTVQVAGVIKKRHDTHLKFDFALQIPSIQSRWWVRTYLLLRESASPAELEKKLAGFLKDNYQGQDATSFRYTPQLQPLTDIHLHSNVQAELGPNGNIAYVYIFLAIAFLILLVACINFMNLATARSAQRAREVGMRKVLGAHRWQLAWQFLSESVLTALIAMLLALLLVELVLPVFNASTGKALHFDYLDNRLTFLVLLGIVLLVSLLAGSYPAFFLSAFQPVKVLKGKFATGAQGTLLRKGLVVAQFAISIIMLIGTGVVYDQLEYVKNKRLGFNKEHVIAVSSRAPEINRRCEALKAELLQNPKIVSIAFAQGLPGRRITSFRYTMPGNREEEKLMTAFAVDHDFIKTLGIKIVAGRDFSKEFGADSTAFILNEAAVQALGWEDSLGRQIGVTYFNKMGTVAGVAKDFHFASLHQTIEPAVLQVMPPGFFAVMAVRVRGDHLPETLAFLESRWKQSAPNHPFEYYFLDKDFDSLYRSEERLGQLFGYFSLLAILVACLGLFGLAAYAAEQRTKEIGVRKVLGVSVAGIISLLSNDFVKLVAFANVIAWPMAYFAMNLWLQDFAYRIDLGWRVFVLAGGLALMIALLTVSTQAIKAALANPVDSLRYE